MILPSIKRILIVPDFGNAEAAERLLPLIEAIKGHDYFDAKIVDLRQMVVDENPDEKLKDVQILDLAAQRLDILATDDSIVWHNSKYREADVVRTEPEVESIISYGGLKMRFSRQSDEFLTQDAPDAILVFGKSVMLAGGVKDVPVLFINPEYDEEWPWRKRYYADRKETDSFYHSFIAKMDAPHNAKVLHFGCEIEYRMKQPQRFCLLTDNTDSNEFTERYPRLVMSDPEFRDPEKLAKAIQEFTRYELETPLIDIYDMLKIPARINHSKPLRFTFPHPVEMEGRSATGILLEGMSPYRKPGEVVLMEAPAHNLSLEGIHDRQALLSLREAMTEAVKTMPRKKRILIVPGLLYSKDSPIVSQLRNELQEKEHYVAVFESNTQLKPSRKGLQRRCKSKPFDLIVTLETGCLLAARVINAPRIFVNPDWTVWKEMKKCGYSREEWETARTMGTKANIRYTGPHCVLGWFSLDQMDGETPKEHMERFGSASYPPRIGLTNEEGIQALAWEIHKMLL